MCGNGCAFYHSRRRVGCAGLTGWPDDCGRAGIVHSNLQRDIGGVASPVSGTGHHNINIVADRIGWCRKAWIELQCRRTRAEVPGLNIVVAGFGNKKPTAPAVDLSKINKQGGEIAKSSIEDIILALGTLKGDPAVGMELFTRQGCIVCHTLKKDEPLKGPFMGQVGSVLKREQIAESILKPSASISQGFATCQIETKDKTTHVGFVSAQSADTIEMRDITGRVWTVKAADVLTRKELETSMMPEGLVNALSIQEFVSLVTFLEGQKN